MKAAPPYQSGHKLAIMRGTVFWSRLLAFWFSLSIELAGADR
jgi:hypothetical protein